MNSKVGVGMDWIQLAEGEHCWKSWNSDINVGSRWGPYRQLIV